MTAFATGAAAVACPAVLLLAVLILGVTRAGRRHDQQVRHLNRELDAAAAREVDLLEHLAICTCGVVDQAIDAAIGALLDDPEGTST